MRPRAATAGLVLVVTLADCVGEEAPSTTGVRLENGSFHAVLNGHDVHYEVRGDGPVLMTLPNSWGLSLGGLRAMYRPLEAYCTVVYFDPRGMGESGPVAQDADMGVAAAREDFDALRRHLGLDRVHAIGWSNGAMNLVLLASERPETLASVIFLHGAASFTEDDFAAMSEAQRDLFERFAAFVREMAESSASVDEKNARMKRFYVETWFPRATADPERNRATLVDLYRDVGFSWAHSRYSQVDMPEFDARDRLAAITVPSLVIAGAHDMLPASKAEELHAGLPDSSLVVFENSGHHAPIEEPERFVGVVREFIEHVEGEK